MKMQEMDNYLIEKGFDVKRLYDGVRKEYFFTIRKDGKGMSEYFKYEGQKSQEDFLDKILAKWVKEYENVNCSSEQNWTNFDPFRLRRAVAMYGGEAKLIVGDQVYHMPISEATVTCTYDEHPQVEVTGCVIKRDSTVEEFCANNVESLYPKMPIVLAARANGKSEFATEVYRRILNSIYGVGPFAIEKVIFNGPATIVMWMDGTKTIVKCQDGDFFDPEKGLAMAISKKAFGNKGNYCDVFKKTLKNCDVYYEETVNNDPHIGDIHNAYRKLLDTLNNKKATKSDLGIAIEEAIGYLGHALG